MDERRIVIFSTAYAPFIGGAEIAVKEITDRLSDCTFDLFTARLDKHLPAKEKMGNVMVYRLGIGVPFIDKLWLAFFGHRTALRHHQEKKYDVVWSIMASYAGLAGLFFKKRCNEIQFLLTLQEGDSQKHIYSRALFIWPWFKKIFEQADQIQAISHYLADWAKRMGGICPITVVPNGVDLSIFSRRSDIERKQQTEWLRKILAVPDETRFIISVSRLEKKNGLDDLVNALCDLPKNIRLLILGDGSERAHLKHSVQQLSLERRIHFLGSIPYQELPQYLAGSEIFCRPSLSEGLGNAFLEAMAVGTPVIGTRVGGIPDFLFDEQTGLFCEPHNPVSIATAVKRLLSDNELRAMVTESAYNLVHERYSWDRVTEDIKKVLFFYHVSTKV